MNKYRLVEKCFNSLPFVQKEMKVKISKSVISIEAKDKEKGANYKLAEQVGTMITGAKHLYDYLLEKNLINKIDLKKLENHIKLCQKNLKDKRIKCCINCPFKDIILQYYPYLKQLFKINETKSEKNKKLIKREF